MQENMTLTSRTWTTIHEMSEVTRLFKSLACWTSANQLLDIPNA